MQKAVQNNHGEVVQRLAPKAGVLRALYLLSGNLCAFPKCGQVMFDEEGDFVGEVCHIEAAEAGGQRFNPGRTNEENRGLPNLVLLCATHHKKTNNVESFPVETMRRLKAEHERRFVDIEKKLGRSFNDMTDYSSSVQAKNLQKLNEVLGFDLDEEQLAEMVKDLGKHAAFLETVPEEVRGFMGAVAARIHKMRDTFVVSESLGTYKISVKDIEGALGLSSRSLNDLGQQLGHYMLGGIDETGDYEMPYAVVLRRVGDWPLWVDLADFAQRQSIDLDVFWKDLDFSSLDR